MRWCIRTIRLRLCGLCDKFLTGAIYLGGISTATTTTLQYTGNINEWRAVAISSIVTFVAIMGCVLRSACQEQTHTSSNNQSTIIINHNSHGYATNSDLIKHVSPITELPDSVAIPVSNIEMTVQSSIPLHKTDILQQNHNERCTSQDII